MEEEQDMTQVNRPRFKRTHYIVSAKFQLRYVGLILMLMFITAIICSYAIYYTVMINLGEKLANVYPQGRLVAIIDTVNFRILMSMALMSPIVGFIGIYLSHKIAGPIYRMERFLTDMSTGNLAQKLVLRKGDELVSVADKINLLRESLSATVGSQKANLQRIITELEYLKKMVDSRSGDISSLDNNIDRLSNEIRDLEKQLDRYKI
jgi:methyl-accepting chemotaxis protein